MTDSGPLWLRAVLASIPLLVALIGGAFAIVNTVNRRTERLKNLVEIRKDFQQALNQDYALERLIFKELNAIERSTTPWYVLWRRLFALELVLVYGGCVVLLFKGNIGNYTKGILTGASFAMALVFWLLFLGWRNRVKPMLDRQQARFKLLNSLAALPETTQTQSPPTDADESQATNHANNTNTTDSTRCTDATQREGD
jgi:hypothetical protein